MGNMHEPGTIWLGDELVYRISDNARAKMKGFHSLSGSGPGVRERQKRILAAAGLHLRDDVPANWWQNVSLLGLLLCKSLNNEMKVNLSTDYTAIAEAAVELQRRIISLFEKSPCLDDELLWELISELHCVAKASRLKPQRLTRAPGRPRLPDGKHSLTGLAKAFLEGFGKNATQTRGGPFERFCSAVIKEIADLDCRKGWIVEKMRGGGQNSGF